MNIDFTVKFTFDMDCDGTPLTEEELTGIKEKLQRRFDDMAGQAYERAVVLDISQPQSSITMIEGGAK